MKDSVDWYRLHECGFDIISKVMFVCPKILTPLIFANMDRSTAMFEDFFFSVVLKYTVAWARIFYQPLQNLTTSSTCAICPNVYKVIWLLKNDASSFTHLSSVAPAHNGNIGLPMEIVKSVFFRLFTGVLQRSVEKFRNLLVCLSLPDIAWHNIWTNYSIKKNRKRYCCYFRSIIQLKKPLKPRICFYR